MKKLALALIGLFVTSATIANPIYVTGSNFSNCPTVYLTMYNKESGLVLGNVLTLQPHDTETFSGVNFSDIQPRGFAIRAGTSGGNFFKANPQCYFNPGWAIVKCDDKNCSKLVLECGPPCPCPDCTFKAAT